MSAAAFASSAITKGAPARQPRAQHSLRSRRRSDAGVAGEPLVRLGGGAGAGPAKQVQKKNSLTDRHPYLAVLLGGRGPRRSQTGPGKKAIRVETH